MNGSDIILLDISMWLANRWCTQAASMVYGACHSLRTKWTVHMYTYIYIYIYTCQSSASTFEATLASTASQPIIPEVNVTSSDVWAWQICIYICWSSVSVSKDTPSSTVPLPPWKRPKEVTRAVHCWSFAYIYIHCLFPMTPNQESSGSMPTSSEPVRVPVRLPLPVANLEVSDSILNIYIYCSFLNVTKSGIIGNHSSSFRRGTSTCSTAIASGQLRCERFNSEYLLSFAMCCA